MFTTNTNMLNIYTQPALDSSTGYKVTFVYNSEHPGKLQSYQNSILIDQGCWGFSLCFKPKDILFICYYYLREVFSSEFIDDVAPNSTSLRVPAESSMFTGIAGSS
jgi:hypothetical protein